MMKHINSDRTAQGQSLMQQVFGTEATAAAATNLGAISPAFLDFLHGTFGDIYGDNTLDLKTKEIIVLVSLITQKDSKSQLKTHLKAALKAGLSQAEILALIKHLILYVGFPTAINALLTAQEVFDESGCGRMK